MASEIPCYQVGAQVSWAPESRIFVGEASTMRWRGGAVALKSPRTGVVKIFTTPVRHSLFEGEVTYWVLSTQDGFRLHIFND